MHRSGFLELISCRLAHCIADMKTVTVTTDVILFNLILNHIAQQILFYSCYIMKYIMK